MLSLASDVVVNSPNAAKYGNLKKVIIEQFSDSDQRKMLSGIDLGDKNCRIYTMSSDNSVAQVLLKRSKNQFGYNNVCLPQVPAILAAINGDVNISCGCHFRYRSF